MSAQRPEGPSEQAESPRASTPRRVQRRRRRWPWIVLALVVVLVGVIGWLGSRVLIVKSELEAAQSALSSVQSGGGSAAIDTIASHSQAAVAAASDPVWRAAEVTPWLGDNLRAVRLGAESLDVLSGQLARPALAAFASHDGQPALVKLVPILTSAAPRVSQLQTEVAAVKRSDALLPPVRSAIDQLAPVLSLARTGVRFGPELLGADGPKNYLVVAQNNAEWVGLGGSAAAQTLVGVDAGRITLKGQADSGDYRNLAVPVDVPENVVRLYHDVILRRINATPSRPDFPTAAQLMAAFWQRDVHNDTIDGVLSIDPIALAQVLKATGGVTIGDGETVTSGNAVKKLLSDVYARNDPDYGDQYFKQVASAIFTTVARGDFDPAQMLTAVQTGVRGGNLMFWSADPALQKRLASSRIGGVLPTRNTKQTAVAVMLREASNGAKIDYYMKPAVAVVARCAASGRTEFAMSTTLKLDLSQAIANTLPGYVKSARWGATKFRTEVFIYGPRGTTLDGADLPSGTAKLRKGVIVDLHRPVASYTIDLKPGQSRTITATFSGTGTYGPLRMWATPSVKGTDVKLSGSFCSSSSTSSTSSASPR